MQQTETRPGALSDLVVLDLTRVVAGPFCGSILGDMGARVIKIENPKGGDDSRAYGPYVNGESAYFALLNRSKQGITLNLKTEQGKAMFLELVKQADVLLENYRPGVMDKLGLGYDVLKEVNPRLIYAAVSGFGSYGPYSQRPGYDILAQAMGGLMPDRPQGRRAHPRRQRHGRHPRRHEHDHRRAGGGERPAAHRPRPAGGRGPRGLHRGQP